MRPTSKDNAASLAQVSGAGWRRPLARWKSRSPSGLHRSLPALAPLPPSTARAPGPARIEFRTTSTHEAEARQPRYGYPWPKRTAPHSSAYYDPFANDQASDEKDAGVPPLPFEEDLDLSDMSASSSSDEKDGEEEETDDDE